MSKKQPLALHRQRPWLDVDDLKARTRITRVLEGYDLLSSMTRRDRSLVGPSPFHGGDDLSFRVDLDRDIWNDFQGKPEGCKGNVIGLVQALEDCPFAQALRITAERFAEPREASDGAAARELEPDPEASDDANADASTAPPNRPSEQRRSFPRPQSSKRKGRGRGRVPANSRRRAAAEPQEPVARDDSDPGPDTDTAPALFGQELRGLRYDVPLLAERGIGSAVAAACGVGYASRGLMKGRIAFPVRTPEGEIAGYVGRAIKPVPRTELWKNPAGFPRSHYLFGLHRILDTAAARKAAKDYGLVVTQSPLDVLRLLEAGFPNGVALMSATASRRQLEQLVAPAFNPTRRVTLFLDNDEAGQAGKREIATKLIHVGFVRYACWKALETGHTSPDRLEDEELRRLLTLRRDGV